MKIIEVTRDQMEATARRAAQQLGGKMFPLRGTIPGTGKTRGIAILPKDVRGSQVAVKDALCIVREA